MHPNKNAMILKTNLDDNKLIFMIWKNGFCVSGTDLVLLTSRLEHSWDPWRKFTYNSRIPPHYSHTLMVVWSHHRPSQVVQLHICYTTYVYHVCTLCSMYHCTVHSRYFLFPCWSTTFFMDKTVHTLWYWWQNIIFVSVFWFMKLSGQLCIISGQLHVKLMKKLSFFP